MKRSCNATSRNSLDIASDAKLFQKTPGYLWYVLVDVLTILRCFYVSPLYAGLHDHFNSCTLQWSFGSDLVLIISNLRIYGEIKICPIFFCLICAFWHYCRNNFELNMVLFILRDIGILQWKFCILKSISGCCPRHKQWQRLSRSNFF